jgi:monovalent cation/proton antiporter MnhG/PhaG subunit
VSAADLAVDVLVALGVAGAVASAVGVLVMRDVYDRLHYAMALTAVPPFLIALAVLVEEGWTAPGVNALLAASFLFALNPASAIAIARAARSRRLGQAGPTARERQERRR